MAVERKVWGLGSGRWGRTEAVTRDRPHAPLPLFKRVPALVPAAKHCKSDPRGGATRCVRDKLSKKAPDPTEKSPGGQMRGHSICGGEQGVWHQRKCTHAVRSGTAVHPHRAQTIPQTPADLRWDCDGVQDARGIGTESEVGGGVRCVVAPNRIPTEGVQMGRGRAGGTC